MTGLGLEHTLRWVSRVFHVALPLLGLGLVAAVPGLDPRSRDPWVIGGAGLAVGVLGATVAVISLQRRMTTGALSHLLFGIGFGALGATYIFAGINIVRGAGSDLVPHDSVGRLALALLLVVGSLTARADASRPAPLERRGRVMSAVVAFVEIELLLLASALLGATGLPQDELLGVTGLDVLRLADGASAVLFALGALVLASRRRPTDASAGRALAASLLAVSAVVLVLSRPGTLDPLVGHAGTAAAIVTWAATLRRARGDERGEAPPLMQRVAGQLDDGLFLFDSALGLRWVNPAGARLVGVSETVRGVTLAELFGDQLPADGALRPSGRRSGGWLEVERAPMSGRPLALAMAAVDGSSDHGAELLVVARDLSAERGARSRAADLEERLDAALRQLDELRGTVERQRSELQAAARTDPASGLPNREAVLARLAGELAQSRRYAHPVSLLAVGLRYAEGKGEGRSVSDEVVLAAAQRLRRRLRGTDLLGRAGVDGFLIVLPHADERQAEQLADALRGELEGTDLAHGERDGWLLAVIGIVTVRPGMEVSVDEVVRRAEAAVDHR